MAKNIFQEIKDNKTKKQQRAEEEQRIREDHLKNLQVELQNMQNQPGLHLPHPVKTHRKKKEIKQVQKEIEDYNDRKKKKIPVIACVVLLAISLVCLGITNQETDPEETEPMIRATENTVITDPSDETTYQATESETELTVPESSVLPLTTENTDSAIDTETTLPTQTELTESVEPTESTIPSTTLEQTEPIIPYTKITAENLTINTRTEYSHISSDDIRLGENEGVTITISIAKPNITEDDLVVLYDEEILDVQTQAPAYQNGTTIVEMYVTGKTPGSTELWIFTSYEIETAGENASGYPIGIYKMDHTDGRIVYVTPSGERYHLNPDCAGASAFKTTYSDAVAAGYTPCKKCA